MYGYVMERFTMDKIAVLIPCYNEEKTIEKVVKDAKAALPEAVVYVYDNNSKDRTVEFAKAAGAVIRYEYMQGKGNVIRRMFREIDAQCYIMVDGDDTYPMEYAAEMVDKVLNKNADMLWINDLPLPYLHFYSTPYPQHILQRINVHSIILVIPLFVEVSIPCLKVK